jgi:hypothetical protein
VLAARDVPPSPQRKRRAARKAKKAKKTGGGGGKGNAWKAYVGEQVDALAMHRHQTFRHSGKISSRLI